jgi:hypothetical protein
MSNTEHQKILRIGIIQGGKIIEERLIRKRDTVSIGQYAGATFSIPLADLPKQYQLFIMKGGNYFLSFTEQMRGNVAVKESNLDFNSIKAQNMGKRSGESYHYQLKEDSRGKVVIGDVTVLFQFVVPPAELPKLQLPELAKGYWLKNLDRQYLTILVIVFLLHFGLIMGVQSAPLPQEMKFEDLPDRFAKMILPDKKPEEAKKPEETGDKEDVEEKVEEKKPVKATTEKASEGSGKAMGRATVTETKNKVMGTGILKVIGSIGTGTEGGALADVLKGGGSNTNLEGALNGIGTIGVATNEGAATRLGAGGSGDGVAGIDQLGTAAQAGNVGKGTEVGKKVASITGQISAMSPEIDGAPDCGKVAGVVKTRMRALNDCYERELKKNPSLAGKISIQVTVEEDGRVSDARIEGNSMGDAAVADCILSRLRNMRFPKRDAGGSCSIVYPFVFVKSQ